MIQIILVRRTWCLSDRNRILTGFISAAVLAQFTVTMALYFNCLLASLNARSNLRENLVIHADDISFCFTDPSSGSEGRMNAPSQISSKALALVSAGLRENDDIEAARHERKVLCSL
ncbi:hypothetical protein ACEPAH_2971 [Sanghuangporus vaninii]